MDLKSDILQIVAAPKQFIWAPFEMAIINIIMAIAVMLMCIAILDVTPFWSMIPLAFGHFALVGLGAKNPHLTTILQATGKYPFRRRNLAQTSKGAKFVP